MKTPRSPILFYILCSLLIFTSCCGGKGGDKKANEESDYYSETQGYKSGSYCADVKYYNPNTGATKKYSLEIEVENDWIVKIKFGNANYLDRDDFRIVQLDRFGDCSLDCYNGCRFDIAITGRSCVSSDATEFQMDLDRDEKRITCSKCGNEKSAYDDYCSDCQHDIDHTCKRCGTIDNFMFSTDDYCSSCENLLENTCSRCGNYEYQVRGGLCYHCQFPDSD